MTLTRGLSKEKGLVHPCSSTPGFSVCSWKSAPGHMTVRRPRAAVIWTRPQIQPRKCVFSRSGVRIVMSPGDVLVMFPTCFEGTLSLRKASVVVIPMASFIVSSFGDVHKRCMKVLPLSLVFFFFPVSASTSGMSSRNICTGTCPPVTRKSSSAARSPPLLMIRSVLPGAGGGGHRV